MPNEKQDFSEILGILSNLKNEVEAMDTTDEKTEKNDSQPAKPDGATPEPEMIPEPDEMFGQTKMFDRVSLTSEKPAAAPAKDPATAPVKVAVTDPMAETTSIPVTSSAPNPAKRPADRQDIFHLDGFFDAETAEEEHGEFVIPTEFLHERTQNSAGTTAPAARTQTPRQQTKPQTGTPTQDDGAVSSLTEETDELFEAPAHSGRGFRIFLAIACLLITAAIAFYTIQIRYAYGPDEVRAEWIKSCQSSNLKKWIPSFFLDDDVIKSTENRWIAQKGAVK